MEHPYSLLKECVAPGTFEQIGNEGILLRIIADGKKIRPAHIPVILRMKALHHFKDIVYCPVFGSFHKCRYIFIMIIECTSYNSCLFDNIGHGYFLKFFLFQQYKKCIMDRILCGAVTFIGFVHGLPPL